MKIHLGVPLILFFCVIVPTNIFGQDSPTPDQLSAYLLQLPQPIKQISVRFVVSRQRDTTWNNPDPIAAPMPPDTEIERLASVTAAVASDPGEISIVAGDNQEHRYGGILGAGSTLLNGSIPSTLTVQQSCYQAASAWSTELDDNRSVSRSESSMNHVIVFDSRGVVCGRVASTNRITEGDILYFGLFGLPKNIGELRRKITTCSIESNAPNILDSTVGLSFQSTATANPILRRWPPLECFDDEIEVIFIKPDNAVAFSEKFQQYKRFRATYQIGALWTKLDERDYTVTDYGEGPIVRESVDGSRGPQYTASLVLYAFPRYFSSLTGNGNYSGRDIVNDNEFIDRFGLFMTIGLDKPKDTLGVGLSFEVATGFNLTFTKLYRRVSRLDGLSLGDAFAGTPEEIPTIKTWKNEITVGLSIDGRYLAKFFGGNSGN